MGKIVRDLSGQWEFRKFPAEARQMKDLEAGDWYGTQVPCSIYESLAGAELIDMSELISEPERFLGVGEKAWVYKKVFRIEKKTAGARYYVVFEKLDTVTKIWFNGKLTGKTDNSFVGCRFDVTELAVEGDNCLMVKFESAGEFAAEQMKQYGRFGENESSRSERYFVRKSHYEFGSEYCPALAGCGIRGGVRFEEVSGEYIANIAIRTIDCDDKSADVKVSVTLGNMSSREVLCRIVLGRGEESFCQELLFKNSNGFNSTIIRIDKPALWHVRGYGEANLYDAEVELFAGSDILDSEKRRFGIRVVKVVRTKSKKGEQFGFEVNHERIFCKGAGWLGGVVGGRYGREDYERLLGLAADANFNMLRVRGDGCYERDGFYDVCDELGIMVWQSFMYGRGYYPDKKGYLDQAEQEGKYQVGRLGNHPSVVIFCGNDGAETYHKRREGGGSRRFYGGEIYSKSLKRVCSEGGVGYIETIPFSVKGVGQICDNCGDINDFGEVEEWGDFVFGFGIQSIPSSLTSKSYIGGVSASCGRRLVEGHNYERGGNGRLSRSVYDIFGPVEDISRYGYLSQVTQARVAKMYAECFRCRGNVNGFLLGQFNDVFESISCSAIEFNGNAKALYYYSRRFFGDIILSVIGGVGNREGFERAVLVNGSDEAMTCTLKARVMDMHGKIVDAVTFPANVSGGGVFRSIGLPRTISNPAGREHCVLSLIAEKDGERIAENSYFYLPDKYVEHVKAKVTGKVSKADKGRILYSVHSDVFVKDMELICDGASGYSDNFIDLVPGREIGIEIFTGSDQLTAKDIDIRINSVGGAELSSRV